MPVGLPTTSTWMYPSEAGRAPGCGGRIARGERRGGRAPCHRIAIRYTG